MPNNPLTKLLPPVETLLALEPEDIAPLLLGYFNGLKPEEQRQLNRHNFVTSPLIGEYAGGRGEEVVRAITEAWTWLEREGLIAPRPGTERDWVFITRRGQKLRSQSDFEAYKRGNLLPAKALDPVLAQKVWSAFIRGDYEVAVFQAYKEVEVRVRKAAGLPDELIGTDLMHKAFQPETGPLTDMSSVKGERQARMELFAGAVGSFKSPLSHKDVNVAAQQASELIHFANYLLRVVDERAAATPVKAQVAAGPTKAI